MERVGEPFTTKELYDRIGSIHLDSRIHFDLFSRFTFEELQKMYHGSAEGNKVIVRILAGSKGCEGGLRIFCPVAKHYEKSFAKPFPSSTGRALGGILREKRKVGFGILIRNFIAEGELQTGGLFSFQHISRDCLKPQTSGLNSADMESFLDTFGVYVEFLKSRYGTENALVYIYDSMHNSCKNAWAEALRPRTLTRMFCMGMHSRVDAENLVKRLPHEIVCKIGLLVLEDLGK
jgi:hypothetical protein